MCGIAGSFHMSETGLVSVDALERMIGTMPHRGPDARGVKVVAPGAGMGHVRLSILDLRPESNQPFEIDDGDYVVTFNGEIYNYVELRDELEALGHRFRTRSDTEVLLVAYKQWGEEAVRRFNGMWAFAIYDRRRDLLFCSRDRFGVKPFSYAVHEGRFLFASEIKAMLAVAPGLARPNWAPISLLLRNHIGEQLEDTFFAGVKRLRPAHNLIVTRSRDRAPALLGLPAGALDGIGMEEAAARVRELLVDAVRLRMRSDVPVAMTLSGGVDSSAIACLLRTFHDAPFETYTAAYPGEPFDEAAVAEKLALSLHMKPHLVPALTGEFLPRLREIVHHVESATYSPAMLPLWNIMRDMRRQRDGGDRGPGRRRALRRLRRHEFPSCPGRPAGARPATAPHWRHGARRATRWGGSRPCSGACARWRRGRTRSSAASAATRRSIPALSPSPRRCRPCPTIDRTSATTSRPRCTNSTPARSSRCCTTAMRSRWRTRSSRVSRSWTTASSSSASAFRTRSRCRRRRQGGAARGGAPRGRRGSRAARKLASTGLTLAGDHPELTAYPVLSSPRCRERGIFDPERLDEALARHVPGKVDLGKPHFPCGS